MPTIDDVARACGVSKATVSKALDPRPGKRDIASATRSRIAAVAAALGYEPAWRLRQAARRRTGNVALIYAARVPVTNGAYEGFAEQVAEALAQDYRRLLFVPLIGEPTDWHRHITDQRFDGCLVVDPMPPHLDRLLAIAGVPAVLINQVSPLGIPQVRADDAHAVSLLVAHLRQLGHRRLAYVMRPRQGHASETVRRAAFETAAPGAPVWITDLAGVPTRLRGPTAPTAIVAYNVHDAVDCMDYLLAARLRVPEDISLVCCDDTLHARLIRPALTVVETPLPAMGVTAVHLLEDLIAGHRQPGPHVVMHQGALIARASSAPPAKVRKRPGSGAGRNA